MTTQIIIIVLLLAALVVLVALWFYARAHRRLLSKVDEKADQLISNQVGGWAQSARQANESTHQQSRIMERMQTILLWLDSWKKNRDKDKPP